jgi:DNA-binding SARP family transcriptional activator
MDVLQTLPLANQKQKAANYERDVPATSCRALLAQALECLCAGRHAEGVALLVQAQAQLPPELVHLASALRAIVQGHTERNQAQEELLAASKHFASIDSEQQTRFLRLEQLLCRHEGQEQAVGYPPVQQIAQLHLPSVTHDLQKRLQEVEPGEALRPDGNLIQQRAGESGPLPPLYIICFGRFTVLRASEPLALCQNRNGQAILRYLVTQANQCATIDALMETFWPDDEPETARRKLQVAVSALRRTLNQGYDCGIGGGYILCKEQHYQINPSTQVTSDVAEFLALYEQGRRSSPQAAIQYYEQACQLYTGACFVEDTYSDWSWRRREQCSLAHATMCNILAEHALAAQNYDEAIHRTTLALAENRCDETAYRLLMQIYAAQGRRSEVMRQYQRCEQELQEELGMAPMPETTQLFHALLTSNSNEHRAFIERK